MSFEDKFERLSDEAMSLRIVEKFLHEVETSLVRPKSSAYDLGTIRACLRVLRPKDEYVDPADELDAECRLRSELDTWRRLLAGKDAEIETFHMRRFCDGLERRVDRRVYLALARFYRGLELSPSVQSKFDLAVTRAYSLELTGKRRRLLRDREFISNELAELCVRWDDSMPDEIDDAAEAVSVFDRFIDEARSLNEFESLVNSNIFERIREAKRGMGATYFHPDCISAAIECNLEVGNAFDTLLAALNADLHGSVRSRFDVAAAFLDVETHRDIQVLDAESELLIFGNMGHETGDLAFMQRLLKYARARFDSSQLRPDDQPDTLLVKDRLANVLSALAMTDPDRTVLRDHMLQSPFLDVLDLNDFLFTRNAEPDIVGRRALAAILCLDEFKENDLKANKELSPEFSSEMVAMLNFAEMIGGALDEVIIDASEPEQNRLLTVANTLLGLRLQVERSVVRFATPVDEPVEPSDSGEDRDSSVPKFELTRVSFLESNKWLMAATAIVVLVCGSILLFSGETINAVPLPEDVEEVAIERLPHSHDIEQAFRKGDTLFVTARAGFEALGEDEKRTALQNMVELELHKPLQNVVVIGQTGRPLADLSAVGTAIHDEPVMLTE